MKTGMMLACCLSTVLAETASAECVDAEDLTDGIVVEFRRGLSFQFQRVSPDLVEVVVGGNDDFSVTSQLIHGFYTVQTIREFEAERAVFALDYGIPPSELTIPNGRMTWAYNSVVRSRTVNSERIVSNAQIEYRAREPKQIRIGDCDYTYIPVYVEFTATNYFNTGEFDYIPSIGISLDLEGAPHDRMPVDIRPVD